jgi:glycosyltransferase involved in cell wall biosynthesis
MQDSTAPLTAVILTMNEEKHIARCIESIRPLCARIVVVDSGSTDGTVAIASALGAEVHERPWPNKYAEQMNYAIDLAGAQTPWMLRIDADEYFTPELSLELWRALSAAPDDVGGFILPRQVIFQGKPIRFGGFYPQWLLRVWRTGLGRCEERAMDEHMLLSAGRTVRLRARLIDHNENDIFWWTEKHNRYARREAADLLSMRHGLGPTGPAKPSGPARSKRWIKERVYLHLPLGLRALSYFCLRFFVGLGFLDHPRVWVFHFLQAGWYRMLVDVNVLEFEDAVGRASREQKLDFLRERWNVRLGP